MPDRRADMMPQTGSGTSAPPLFRALQNNRNRLLLSCVFACGMLQGLALLLLPFSRALALLAGGIVFVIAVLRIDLAFYFTLLSILLFQESTSSVGTLFYYFQDINIPGIPSLLEMALILFISAYLVRLILKVNSISAIVNWQLLAYLLFCAFAWYTGYSQAADETLLKEDLKRFLIPALFFVASHQTLASWSSVRLRRLMWLIFSISFLKACIGILHYLQGRGFPYGESRVVFIETADHLLFVTMIVAVFSLLSSARIRANAALLLVSLAPFLFSILFSYRRNSWLGLLLSLTLLFLLATGTPRIRLLGLFAASTLTLLLLLGASALTNRLPSAPFLKNRLFSTVELAESSNEAHLREWAVTVEDTSAHPIKGLGFGSRHRPVPGYEGINTHTVHNAFLMVWMKMGLPAALLVLYALFRYIRFGIRKVRFPENQSPHSIVLALLSVSAYWLVSLSVGPTWFYYRETCLMSLAAALVILLPGLPQQSTTPISGRPLP